MVKYIIKDFKSYYENIRPMFQTFSQSETGLEELVPENYRKRYGSFTKLPLELGGKLKDLG